MYDLADDRQTLPSERGDAQYDGHRIVGQDNVLFFVFEIISIDAEGNNDYEEYANQVGERTFDGEFW